MPFVLFNFSFLSSIVLALTSAVTNLSNKTLIFHDFHGPKIKFHDFPGLENEILKIHDLTCTHPVVWCQLVILFQNIYSWVSQWGRYTPGDKLQQHVAETDHPMCTGRVTSCSNKVRRTSQQQIVSCVLENFCENLCLRDRILSLQQVAKNQIRLNLCDLLWRQNSVAATKFSQNSPLHTNWFVAATCRHNVLLQLVA